MYRIPSAVLALILFAGLGFGQQITADFDRQYDLSSLKTFGFAEQKRDAKDALADNDILARRIQTALQTELQKNAFKPASGPDFLIAYYASIATRKTIQAVGYGRPRWGGSGQAWVDEYAEGTVVVDFISPKSGELVWRAAATRTLDPKNSEKNVNKGAEKVIKQFMKNIKEQQKARAKKK